MRRQAPILLILSFSAICGCSHDKPVQQVPTPAATVQVTPPKPIFRFQIAHHGLAGFIDATGNEVINAQFDDTDDFSEGYAPVRKGAAWGYVDPSGHIAISCQFDKARAFSSGLAPVSVHGKWAYIGTSGKIVINPQFDGAEPFSEGLAGVKLSDRWGFIDKTGKLIINPQFQTAGSSQTSSSFSQGLCVEPDTTITADSSVPRYGYIGTDGKWVISPQFDMAFDFHENLAPVESGDRWGYIGKTGTFTINPQFDQAQAFNSDRALVKLGNSYGYIGLDGKYVINPQYDEAESFSENLAAVKQGRRYGYINPDGSFAINPQFDDALPFENGLAVVFVNGQIGYINTSGKFVWGPVSIASTLKAAKPQPPPQPAAAQQPTSDDPTKAEVRARFDGWLKAWRSMDINAYMSFYSPDVLEQRSGQAPYGYDTLRQNLTNNWAKQTYITIQSQEPVIEVQGDTATVSVAQHYDSTTWWDEGTKIMIWKKQSGDWYILGESFLKRAGGAK